MASPLKCPNPDCPFLFDPVQVPPGAVIACPRCALRFTLAPPPPAIPGYAPALGYVPSDPPPAPKSSFQEDLFADAVPKSEGSATVPVGRLARKVPGRLVPKPDGKPTKPRGRYGSLISILVAAGIVSGIGAVGLGFVFLSLYKKSGQSREETSTEIKYPDLNLQFHKPLPASGWTKHDAALVSFHAALFGYVLGDENAPSAWIVGDARKFGYAVRPSDLLDRVTSLLDDNFDNVTATEEPRADTLCGRVATRYLYRATQRKTGDNVVVEVHTLATKSVGVWVFAWAAEREFAGFAAAFQNVRAGLQIAKTNDSDFDMPTGVSTHRSKSGLFTLKDSDGLWAKKDPPASLDPDGTLWLRGTPKTASGRNKPSTVDLVVAEIEPGGDPKSQASEIVRKSLPEGEPIVEELTGEPTGDPAAGERNPATPVTRWKVKYKGADAGVNKLVVYSAVASQGKLVVCYAACPWKDLGYWEQRLMQIVGSLTPRTK